MIRYFFIIFFLPLFLLAKAGYFEPWGKDTHLLSHKEQATQEKKLSIPSWVANKIIIFHQKVLSPVDGPRSNFRPTSSRYMQLAIRRYGFWQGFLMGMDRLLRENDEKWIYQKITIDGITYKYDPAIIDKKVKIK